MIIEEFKFVLVEGFVLLILVVMGSVMILMIVFKIGGNDN